MGEAWKEADGRIRTGLKVTYNGDKHEVNLDAYKKKENMRFVGKVSVETRGAEFEMCSLRP